MTDYSVKISFKGDDSLSSAINKVRSNMKRFGDDSKSIFKRMNKDALSVKKIIGGILGARAITAGITLARQSVTVFTEEVIKLDKAAVAASARFGFDRQAEGFKKITDEARAVGAATRFTAGEAAEAIDFFAKAGYNLNDSLKLVAPTAELAVSAGLDLATTADIASDSLGAFGLNVDQYQKASDILSFTANSTNTTLEEMFETIKLGAPLVKLAGGDMALFSGMIRPMAAAGIKGTIAATTLKNAMLFLTSGKRSAGKEMKKLGISISDSNGDLLDMVDILGQLEVEFDKMGPKSLARIQSMGNLFGPRAAAGMSALFDQGIKKTQEHGKATLAELREQANQSAGYVKKQAARMSQSYESKLLSIKSAIVEVGFAVFESFGEDIPKYLNIVIKKIRSIDPKKIKTGIQDFIKLTKTVISTVNSLIPVIKTVIVAWVSYKTVMGAIIAIHTVRHMMNVANSLLGASNNANALTGNLRNASTATGTLNKGLKTSLGRADALAVSVAAVALSLKAGYEFGKLISEKYLQPQSQRQAEKFRKSEAVSERFERTTVKPEKLSGKELKKGILDINKAIVGTMDSYFSTENMIGELTSFATGVESPSEKRTSLVRDLSAKRQTLEYFLEQKQIEESKTKALGIIVNHNKATLDKMNQLEDSYAYLESGVSNEPTAGKIDFTNKVKVDSTISFKNEPKGTEVLTTVSAPKTNRAELGVS